MGVAFRFSAPFAPLVDEPSTWVAALDYMEREFAFEDGDQISFSVWVECLANAWIIENVTDPELVRAAHQRNQMSDQMVRFLLRGAKEERGIGP